MAQFDYADVPDDVIERLRAIASRLPESDEAQAWVGQYFRIRRRNFVHVLAIDHPEHGPQTLLILRADPEEREVLLKIGRPYFQPGWGANTLGVAVGDDTDWDEIAELVTESYRVLAPKKLAAMLGSP